MGSNSQNYDFFCSVHVIFLLFVNIPQEKIFITLTAIAIEWTNQLVPSIAAFPTWSCQNSQRGAEMRTHSEVYNSEHYARSATILSLATALYFSNFSCGLNWCYYNLQIM